MRPLRQRISESLNARRLGLLVLRELSGGYRSVVIAMLAVGGFVILSSVFSAFTRQLGSMHARLYAQLLFVAGLIVTSLSFREIHQDSRSVFYLTLPGSTLEKFLSKLLVTSLGFVLGSLVFYTAAAAAAEGLNRLIFGYGHPFFRPFDRDVLLAVAVYLVSQSVFLAGSVYFRRLAFLRTALYLVLLGMALSLVTGVGMWYVFRDFADGRRVFLGPYFGDFGQAGDVEAVLRPLAERFARLGKVLFWAALAPVAWLIGYLRLRETEV